MFVALMRVRGGRLMLKLTESQAAELVAELAQKCDRRWQETVDQTRFMNELRTGKLKKQTIQLFYKNWGSFVPVINIQGIFTPPNAVSAFPRRGPLGLSTSAALIRGSLSFCPARGTV